MIYQSIFKCNACIDHISGHQQFKCPSFAYQLNKSLRSAVARYQPEIYFWLSEFCILTCDTKVTSHCKFTTTTQCESIDCSNNRFAAIFNFEKNILPCSC